MKLLFRQRVFSWLDSYDIFDENDSTVFTVGGQLSFGHRLNITDQSVRQVGMVQEKVLTLLPRFELYENGALIGTLQKELTFLRPKYMLDFNDWKVEGSVMEWDYTIKSGTGALIATVSKELFHLSDTYVMDIVRPEDALYVLMIVLAIDAEKCSRS